MSLASLPALAVARERAVIGTFPRPKPEMRVWSLPGASTQKTRQQVVAGLNTSHLIGLVISRLPIRPSE